MSIQDRLEIINPDGSVAFHALDPAKGVINIGRHPDNDVVIDSPDVALFQAVLDHRRKPYQIMILSEEGDMRLDGQSLTFNQATVFPGWATLEIDGYMLVLAEGADASLAAAPPVGAARPGEARPAPPAPAVPSEEAPAELEGVVPEEPPPDFQVPVSTRPAHRLPARPPDVTDEAILVEMAEREWTIGVEQPAMFTVTLVNGGPIVATFVVQVEGIEDGWLTIDPPQVNLFEKGRQEVTISITPPRHPSSRAGDYPLAVVVTSPDYPGHTSQVGATLTISPYYEFGMGELSPKQQTVGWRKSAGKATLPIANLGNSEATFRLEAMDDERACNFEFEIPGQATNLARQAEMRLLPEESVPVPIYISPIRKPLIALRKHSHSFSVTATMLEGEQLPRSLLGQIKVRPLVGPWLLLLVLALLVVGFVLVFRPVIYEFQVDPQRIQAGERVTLTWQASLFSNVRLDTTDSEVTVPPLEDVAGKIALEPTKDQKYTLVAENLVSQLIPWLCQTREETVSVNPVKPDIVFSVDKETILAGETVTLRWEVTNADTLVLSINGNEETLRTTEHIGERQYTPNQNPTNYTLRATNRYASESKSAMVTILTPTPTALPSPVIKRFSVFPLQITRGQTVTLTWETENATKVKILNQDYLPNATTLDQPSVTTEYVLEAIYEDKTGVQPSASTLSPPVVVIVNPSPTPTPAPEKPVIADFRVVPDEIVGGSGKSVELVWSVTGETTNVEISGPTLGTVSNLNNQGSLKVQANATTFFILTAYNGDLAASQTAELAVTEPTPTPLPPTPTPTPLPAPVIDYFVLDADNPGDVTLLASTLNTNKYQVRHGAQVELRWLAKNVSNVTLSHTPFGSEEKLLGVHPSEGTLPIVVTEEGRYKIEAVNESGSAYAYVQIEFKPVTPPPPPQNVNGPSGPASPIIITWSYDAQELARITGFRIYRAVAPFTTFFPVATVGTDLPWQWEDTVSPSCGYAYYVTATYTDVKGNTRETAPSPNRYYSWPCPTPTPGSR